MQWDLRTALNTFHIFSVALLPAKSAARHGVDFRQVHNDGVEERVGQKMPLWRVAQGFRNFASTSMSLVRSATCSNDDGIGKQSYHH